MKTIHKTAICFLGLCLLLTSCGHEDSHNAEGIPIIPREQNVQMIVGASLPETGIYNGSGKAANIEVPEAKNCYLQLLAEDGSELPNDQSKVIKMDKNGETFSIAVMIDPNVKYDFLFWADNAEETPTNLKNVKYNADGNTIAFAAKIEDQGWNRQGIETELKCAVTRISVKTNADALIDDAHTLKAAVPLCYEAYDVSLMKPLEESKKTDFVFSGFTSAQADEEMGSFYVICRGETETITLEYTDETGTDKEVFPDTLLAPDRHVILITDAAILGYVYDADSNTYNVSSGKGLRAVADIANNGNLKVNIALTNNIDLTGLDWIPIGSYKTPYTGSFNGNKNTVTGLTYDAQNIDCAGMFGAIGTEGKVLNLYLKNIQIKGNNFTGGVTGYNNGIIENCSVNGAIAGNGYVGGVAGFNEGGGIIACSSEGTVTAKDSVAGGIIGMASWNSYIEACVSLANVMGFEGVGGIAGVLDKDSEVITCYSHGSVTGSRDVGGVIGWNETSRVFACYHAIGNVTSSSDTAGGVGGRNHGSFVACYWSDGSGAGIGSGSTSGASEITNGDWDNAIEEMNRVLFQKNCHFRYLMRLNYPSIEPI